MVKAVLIIKSLDILRLLVEAFKNYVFIIKNTSSQIQAVIKNFITHITYYTVYIEN